MTGNSRLSEQNAPRSFCVSLFCWQFSVWARCRCLHNSTPAPSTARWRSVGRARSTRYGDDHECRYGNSDESGHRSEWKFRRFRIAFWNLCHNGQCHRLRGKQESAQIKLNVGATVNVNLAMAVAALAESIQVTGTFQTVDTSSSTSGTTLDTNQIANLPVNGRDLSDFLEVAPGSVDSTGFFQGSVNGLDNIFTGLNITLDGQSATRGDINGFLDTEGQEQARITRASVDSVQEIDFSNSGYRR